MLQLEASKAIEEIDDYVNDKPEGANEEIWQAASSLYGQLTDTMFVQQDYYDKMAVIFPPMSDFIEIDDQVIKDFNKALNAIPKKEIAFKASNLAFLFGLVYAEKLRLGR